MIDTQKTWRYCSCSRGETKHELGKEEYYGPNGQVVEVLDVWFCTECGEEKEA